MYEIKVDLNRDAVEELTYRFTFDPRDVAGKQRYVLRRVAGAAATDPHAIGRVVCQGTTGEIVTTPSGLRVCGGPRRRSLLDRTRRAPRSGARASGRHHAQSRGLDSGPGQESLCLADGLFDGAGSARPGPACRVGRRSPCWCVGRVDARDRCWRVALHQPCRPADAAASLHAVRRRSRRSPQCGLPFRGLQKITSKQLSKRCAALSRPTVLLPRKRERLEGSCRCQNFPNAVKVRCGIDAIGQPRIALRMFGAFCVREVLSNARVAMKAGVSSPKSLEFRCVQNGLSARRSEPGAKGAYLDRYVTDEQRSSRPIFNATLRAAAGWLFFRVARSTRMTQIWAFRSRLEKQISRFSQPCQYANQSRT